MSGFARGSGHQPPPPPAEFAGSSDSLPTRKFAFLRKNEGTVRRINVSFLRIDCIVVNVSFLSNDAPLCKQKIILWSGNGYNLAMAILNIVPCFVFLSFSCAVLTFDSLL